METMTVTNHQNTATKSSLSSFCASIFSQLLEEQVSPRQARAILIAIIAFFALIISSAAPIWTSFLALAWFILSLRNCRRLMNRQQDNNL